PIGRALLVAALAACSFAPASSARADMISPTEALANWSKVEDPYAHFNVDWWKVTGANSENLDYDNVPPGRAADPIGQALVSNFTVTGDFTFSARVTSLHTDDDIFGLVFGYKDSNNHYRLSWDGGGFEEVDNHRGLHLVREVGGVATVLYWPDP